MTNPKLLYLDVERVPMWTKPLPVWSMKDLQNRRLGPGDIQSWGRVITMAYQWIGESPIYFAAEWEEGGRTAFLRKLWDVMTESDVILGHNSKYFDVPHLHGEFALEGWGPPAPSQHFDTLLVARRQFNYEANHLDTLTKRFGISSKVDKYRIEMAQAAVQGDGKARKRIERYNKGDIRAGVGLVNWLKPWGDLNLNVFLETEQESGVKPQVRCPACLSTKVQRRGVRTTKLSRYPQYHCQNKRCGKWFKLRNALGATTEARP